MPRSRLARVALPLSLACSLLATGHEADAHSHFPAVAIGTVRPGSVGCSFTRCFVILDSAKIVAPRVHQERTSVTLSLDPEGKYTDAGRPIDFESFVKSLAAGDRIAVISEMDTDASGGLAGPALGLARLGRAPAPGADLFPLCGAPPWSKETLAACKSAPRTGTIELRGRVAVAPVTDPVLDEEAQEIVVLDEITLRSGKVELTPPSNVEVVDLTRKRLAKMTKERPNVKSLVAGDHIKLDVVYEMATCSPDCWPRVKAAGPVTVEKR